MLLRDVENARQSESCVGSQVALNDFSTYCYNISLTLLVLGDFLLTLYWGGDFSPPLFFSENTGDITVRLIPIVL